MQKTIVILAAPCILNADLQAVAPIEDVHWGSIFSNLMHEKGVEVFALPCTESDFCGIPRIKHGLDYYQALNGYPEYCNKLAFKTAQEVQRLTQGGKHVVACLGVEHSPSCAVSYMYTHHGTVKRAGIFFESLFTYLEQMNIQIVKIGINRKHPRNAYIKLLDVLNYQ